MASYFLSQLQHYSSTFTAAFVLLPMQEFLLSLQVSSDRIGLFSIPALPLGKANLSLMEASVKYYGAVTLTLSRTVFLPSVEVF